MYIVINECTCIRNLVKFENLIGMMMTGSRRGEEDYKRVPFPYHPV